MILTAERLVHDALTLGRFLTVVSGKAADETMATTAAFREREAASGPLAGRWCCCRWGPRVGYLFISEHGAGRYRREPPPDLDPAALVTVTVDPEARPATELLAELTELVDLLSSGSRVKIEGSGETVELAGSRDVGRIVENLKLYLAGVWGAISPGYNERVVRAGGLRLRETLLSGEGRAACRDELLRVAGEVLHLRAVQAADAPLAGWFLVWRDVCRAVEERFAARHDRSRAALEMVRYLGFGAAGAIVDPDVLTAMTVHKLSREGLAGIAAELADGYLRMGERYICKALEADSIEVFGGTLYASALFLYTALQIFRALCEDPARTPSDYEARAANVAEEKLVRVAMSFENAVANRTGARLRDHRLRVREARRSGGAEAEEQALFELIDMKYYYPRCFRERLLEAPQAPGGLGSVDRRQ